MTTKIASGFLSKCLFFQFNLKKNKTSPKSESVVQVSEEDIDEKGARIQAWTRWTQL